MFGAKQLRTVSPFFFGEGGGEGVVMYPVWRILGAIYPGVPGEGI